MFDVLKTDSGDIFYCGGGSLFGDIFQGSHLETYFVGVDRIDFSEGPMRPNGPEVPIFIIYFSETHQPTNQPSNQPINQPASPMDKKKGERSPRRGTISVFLRSINVSGR